MNEGAIKKKNSKSMRQDKWDGWDDWNASWINEWDQMRWAKSSLSFEPPLHSATALLSHLFAEPLLSDTYSLSYQARMRSTTSSPNPAQRVAQNWPPLRAARRVRF